MKPFPLWTGQRPPVCFIKTTQSPSTGDQMLSPLTCSTVKLEIWIYRWKTPNTICHLDSQLFPIQKNLITFFFLLYFFIQLLGQEFFLNKSLSSLSHMAHVTLRHAWMVSRLDYSSVLYTGTALKLQLALNAAAHLISRVSCQEHITYISFLKASLSPYALPKWLCSIQLSVVWVLATTTILSLSSNK